MDENGETEVEIDVDKSALGAILKAIANYDQLVSERPGFIKAMLTWSWLNYDGENIVENSDPNNPDGKKMMDKYEHRSETMKKTIR